MTTLKNPSELIPRLVKKWVTENLETQAPAVIIDVKDYSGQRCVAVQPLIMEQQEDGDVIVPTIIHKAPVLLQGCSEGFLSFPLKVGDRVMIGYCKRSLEDYLTGANSEQFLPSDVRVFGSTDVVVMGVIGQVNIDIQLDPDNVVLQYKDTRLVIKPDGDLEISMPNTSSCIINDCVIDGLTGNVTTGRGADLDALYEAFMVHAHTSVVSLNSTPTPPLPASPPLPPLT